MLAVTTFPPEAWPIYAKVCTDQLVSTWPGSIRIYYEGFPPDYPVDRVECRPLDSKARTDFLNRPIKMPRHSFLFDAKRFCHKVFAQIDAAADGEPFWWIDADVVVHQPVPESLLKQHDFVTYLGRDSYTETGLVGFNPRHDRFADFMARYAAYYDNGTITGLAGWTDCHAFDAARQGGGENLTPEGRGFENVMRQSKFGDYMAHFKGPLKFDLYRLGVDNALSTAF